MNCDRKCAKCPLATLIKPGQNYVLDGELFVHTGPTVVYRNCDEVGEENRMAELPQMDPQTT